MNRSIIVKRDLSNFSEIKENLKYWLTQDPQARIEAVEFLRKQYHGNLPKPSLLIRISTANADSALSAVSDSVGPAQRTVKYASHGLDRLPRIQSRLDVLVTKSDKKPGLVFKDLFVLLIQTRS